MPPKLGIVALVLVGIVAGMLLTPQAPLGSLVWPPSDDLPTPTDAQLPLFLLLSVIEAVAFGAGLAFLVYGRALFDRAPGSRGLARAAHLAVVWGLVSWVPHDALHVHNGMALGGLLAIEYGFHVTLIVAASVLAAFLVSVLRTEGATTAAATTGSAVPQAGTRE